MGEMVSDKPLQMISCYSDQGQPLHSSYHFGFLQSDWSPKQVQSQVEEFFDSTTEAHPTWCFSNHDAQRVLTRWGKHLLKDTDPASKWDRLALSFLALNLFLPGVSVIYQGEELGLTQAKLARCDLQDPFGIEFYPEFQGRDGCRTPLPWSDELPKKSWLPIPQEHLNRSVALQSKNDNSLLRYFQRLLACYRQFAFDDQLKWGDVDSEALEFQRFSQAQKSWVSLSFTWRNGEVRVFIDDVDFEKLCGLS